MAADAPHLRMDGIPSNEDDVSPVGLLCHNLMNFGDKGAGGVAAFEPLILDGLDHSSGYAVRAYNDHSPLRHRADLLHDDDAAPLQIGHHLRIVDDRAEGIDLFSLPKHGVYKVNRTVDAEAEACCLCQLYFLHGPSSQSSVIRPMIRREASRNSRVPPSSVMPSSS